MFYDFATDLTLDEVRSVVAEHNENLGASVFIEADRGDFIIFNYVIQFDGAWLPFTGVPEEDRKAAILRELRGITFDKETGQVALRKLHKFFNSGQNAESDPNAIDWTQAHDILVKADGSMLTPYKNRDGSWEWHSKMGATDMTLPVMNFVAKKPKYNEFAEHCLAAGLTIVFEWCSRQQRIVIDYPVDDLVLLAARYVDSGQYVAYAELSELAAQFGITIIDRVEGSVTDHAVFTEAARALKDQEGYVIRFHNGHMVKIKADEYCMLHNTKEKLNFEKNVIEMIFADGIDDMLPQLDENDRRAVSQFLDDAMVGVAESARVIAELAVELCNKIDAPHVGHQGVLGREAKKQYAALVNSAEMPNEFAKRLLFRAYDGNDMVAEVIKIVVDNTGSSTKVDSIRPLIGGINWNNYRGFFDAET